MKKGLILLGLLFLIPFISAQPPLTVNIDFEQGLVIIDSQQTYLKQNEDFTMQFYVYNRTNGIVMDNSSINCSIFLSDNHGNLLFHSYTEYSSEGYWEETLNGTYFSRVGFYNYGIQCQDTDMGGSTIGVFYVTPTGRIFSTSDMIGALSVLFGALLTSSLFMWLGFKLGESDKTLPFGFLLVSVSIILVLYSLFLGYVFSQNIIGFEAMSSLSSTIFTLILWIIVGMFVLFIAMMLIAFIRELGRMNQTKKFGSDFSPISNTYE